MTVGTGRILLTRRSPTYWRVSFDLPPLNIFGPAAILQLDEIVTALETDEEVRVVVFDSAVDGFFLTHYDFTAKLEDTTRIPPGPTGLQALPDMLARVSRAPVVSIASIRGRATGVGSELALASDMRFASREKAVLSQWEVGRGTGTGRRSDGTAAAVDRARPRPRSPARGRRHRWRTRRALRLCQPRIAGCGARRVRRRARHQDRVVRQTGDRRNETSRRREQPASRRGDRARMGGRFSPHSDAPRRRNVFGCFSSGASTNRATSRHGSDTTLGNSALPNSDRLGHDDWRGRDAVEPR